MASPALKYVPIKDFSPGVMQFSRGAGYPTMYPVNAPIGSAAYAYGCYMISDIGLAPLPTYTPVLQYTFVNATGNPSTVALGQMQSITQLVGSTRVDSIVSNFDIQVGSTNYCNITRGNITIGSINTTPNVVYTSSQTSGLGSLPCMDFGLFQDTNYNKVLVTTDNASQKWVTVPDLSLIHI